MSDKQGLTIRHWGRLTAVALIVAVVLATGILAIRRHDDGSCASNLRQIGQAMQEYLADNDQMFPPAYTDVWDQAKWNVGDSLWADALEPYVKSGQAVDGDWGWVDGWGDTILPRGSQAAPQSSRISVWHCPDDHDGTGLSYGVNSMVSGAFLTFDVPGPDPRRVGWQASRRMSEVGDPANVIWAGDTNRFYDLGKQTYGRVFPEWPRRTDLYLSHRNNAELVAWYRDFLSHDNTDYADQCPYPTAWGCRGPAYRHIDGDGTPSATMLMCDGHVRSMPFGTVTVANIFPNLTDVVAGSASQPEASDHDRYRIVDLGPDSNVQFSHNGGINDLGEAVGSTSSHLFAWRNGKLRDAGSVPGFQWTGGYAINDAGVVAGEARAGARPVEAFRWHGGKFQLLGTLPGCDSSYARAIDARGDIIGKAFTATGGEPEEIPGRAFVWSRDRGMTALELPREYKVSTAYGINDRGLIVGMAITNDDHTHACLWRDGTFQDLGTLPGGSVSIAFAVNNMGQVVGDSDVGQYKTGGDGRKLILHPFLWENGKMRDLGVLPGYRYITPKSINNHGEIVCYARDFDQAVVSPLLWDANHGLRSLDTLCPPDSGWLLREVYRINDSGQIVGWGMHGPYQYRNFVATPTSSLRTGKASGAYGKPWSQAIEDGRVDLVKSTAD